MALFKKAEVEKVYGDVIVIDNIKSHANDPYL